MKKIKELKNNKIVKGLITAINAIILIFVIGFILTVYMQRFSDNKLSFFNYRMFTVITSSMEPKYNIGDVLLSKEVDPSTVKVVDSISYEGTAGDVRGKIITHEVVGIEQNTKGKYIFKAKGLSNIIEDPNVYEEQLLGVVVHKIKILSFIYKIIATNAGFYLCIIVPLIVVIGYEIAMTMFNITEKKRCKMQE